VRAVAGCLVVALLVGCATTGRPTAPGVPIAEWHIGDEWEFRTQSPGGGGTFVWVVDRVESLSGQEHYVVKSGAREIYYRRDDFRFTREMLGGSLVREVTPSIWSLTTAPLSIGQSFAIRYHEVRAGQRPGEDLDRVWTVEGQETVVVPAGSFTAYRIVCKNARDDTWVRTVWYSPAVKHFVRDEVATPEGRRVRELLQYRPR